jgi:hypothetical protein
LGGCAAISGLDQIQESECAPNCDAGADRTIDSPVGDDSPTGTDATQEATSEDSSQHEAASDDSGGNDGATGKDAQPDAPDASKDAGPDGASDASPDAPFDSGCGPLNVVNNCSACGDKCASTTTVETSSSCSGSTNGAGATCSYTCATGYLDCNGTLNPPDLDGCECHSPGATQANCGSNGCCPVQHSNGLGTSTSTFYDCVLSGTYNTQVAKDACIAFVGKANAAQCTPGQCVGPDGGANGDQLWCSSGSPTDCVCWTFAGPDVGHVHDQGASGQSNCFCPNAAADPTYN